MDKIEKIRAYIKRTAVPREMSIRYAASFKDIVTLAHEMSSSVEAVVLAVDYGFAKGYRAAKANMKMEGTR